jgi:hypothetical protein
MVDVEVEVDPGDALDVPASLVVALHMVAPTDTMPKVPLKPIPVPVVP